MRRRTNLEKFKQQLARARRLALRAAYASGAAWRAGRDLEFAAHACAGDGCDPLIRETVDRINQRATETARLAMSAAHNHENPLDAAVRLLGAKETR